jgi:hypothetical protein
MTTTTTTHEGHDVWPMISKPGAVWCRACKVEFDSMDLRPAWVAAGRPAAHPYMVAAERRLAAPRPRFVEPMVRFA